MNKCDLFNGCLYFTSARLSRIVSDMADEEFRLTGLSPSHAFLMMAVNSTEGITPMEAGEKIHLAPSTVTRLADKLEQKGLITRRASGRNSIIHSTKKGKAIQKDIEKAWASLYEKFSEKLGTKENEDFTSRLCEIIEKLEK